MRIETARLLIAPATIDAGAVDRLLDVFNSNPDYLEGAEGRRVYGRGDVETYLSTETTRPSGRCLTIRLREDGAVVGTAALLVPHSDGRPWIGLLVVHGDHQGAGLGREAALAIEDALAREGWREVRLGVLAGDERALGFWASCGYAVVGETETAGGAPCRVLAKAIGEPAESR